MLEIRKGILAIMQFGALYLVVAALLLLQM